MTFQFKDALRGTLDLYGSSAREATQALTKNWVIIPGVIACFAIWLGSAMTLLGLGILGQFLISLVGLALLTLYYRWVSVSVRKQRLRIADLFEFDVSLMLNLVSVLFILWVMNWMVRMLTTGMDADWTFAFLTLAVVVLFNALPEVVYQQRYDSILAYQESFKFTRDNCIEWFLPFLLVISPVLVVSSFESLPLILAGTFPMLPTSVLFTVPQTLLGGSEGPSLLLQLLGLMLANWFMLFRGFLFQGLAGGTRRSRAFLAKQK